MERKQKLLIVKSLLVMLVLATCFIGTKFISNAGSSSWNFKDNEFKKLGKITSTKTVSQLTLIATSSKDMEVKANKQTLEGTEYKYCLCLKGKGNTSYRAVKVPIKGDSRLKITLMSSGKEDRNLIIADSKGNKISTLNANQKISLQKYDYYGSDDYIYLYSENSGINIFKIQVDDINSKNNSNDKDNENEKTDDNKDDNKDDKDNINSDKNNTSDNTNEQNASTDTNNNANSDLDNGSNENAGKVLTITETIKVAANETYDGKGIKIIANGMGDGSQDEGQSPIFRLEKGASLKNVIIGAPGCDGVHCYGDNTVTNVVWEDVGEDALTVKGGESSNAGKVTINGGTAKYATDKMFQINAPCTFIVNNFNGYDMGKFIRQNGDTKFDVEIHINSCILDKVNNCIFKTDSTTTKLYYSDLKVSNCKKMWDVPNESQIIEQKKTDSIPKGDSSKDNASNVPNGYIVVAVDGSGEYKSLQKALNAGKKNIYVKSGVYKEVITLNKNISNVSIIGENADSTVFTFDNYSGKSNGSGGTYGTGGSASFFVKGNNTTIENVTITNSFIEKGNDNEQAVALYANGTKNIFKNCKIKGNQDTLCLYGGTQYFENCYIEGDVDFIFGNSQAVFEGCEICSLDRNSSSNNGYITAASTAANKPYGFIFLNCNLTASASVASNSVHLGRPWCPKSTSENKGAVAFINCNMGAHIKNEPWTSMSGVDASHGRFFEYGSVGAGAVVNASRPQLSSSEADRYKKYKDEIN